MAQDVFGGSKENILYQDNMSAMKLETNGRMSSGKNTRHIDIKYFFAKDRVDTEGISIVHCPTEQMLADFFTKPLQGALFKKFKAVQTIPLYKEFLDLEKKCLIR